MKRALSQLIKGVGFVSGEDYIVGYGLDVGYEPCGEAALTLLSREAVQREGVGGARV